MESNKALSALQSIQDSLKEIVLLLRDAQKAENNKRWDE